MKITDRKTATGWQKKYDAHAPKIGDTAPDFSLCDADGQNPVRLSDYRQKKPVALIFGSFTWPPYVKGTVGLSDLYAKYSECVKFIPIYIREAHPVDGWWFGKGFAKKLMRFYSLKVAMDVYDPQTMDERRQIAGACETSLSYDIRTYVDEMDDTVNKAYAGWPTRLYLIDTDGVVVYAAGLGPYGFHPSKFKKAIENYL